ncbi:MAG: hypothetical protein ACXWQO_09700 [Bdellovibrionota bacterium]
MKKLITTLALALASTTAFAHPGSNSLSCRSAAKSGSKQKLEVTISRSNALGTFAPVISVTLDGKKYVLTTEDEMKNYGDTFHNAPLGVITVTGSNENEENAQTQGYLSVVGVPSTVKAYSQDGKRVNWTFEGEKDECNDSYGKGIFQGIFHGHLRAKEVYINLDAQIMDCELTYNPGSAC